MDVPLEILDNDPREEIRQELVQLWEADYLDRDVDMDRFIDPDYEPVDDGSGEELYDTLANQLGRNIAISQTDDFGDSVDDSSSQMDIETVTLEDFDDTAQIKPPTPDQALEMLEQLGRFEAVQKDSLPEFMHFLSKYEEHIRKRQKQNVRKRTIDDLFLKHWHVKPRSIYPIN